jgi:hypothetical protein
MPEPDPNCDECDGTGVVTYGGVAGHPDGVMESFCEKCFLGGGEEE